MQVMLGHFEVRVADHALDRRQVIIPASEYRKSGETETDVPVFRKPSFRRFGNRCPAGA